MQAPHRATVNIYNLFFHDLYKIQIINFCFNKNNRLSFKIKIYNKRHNQRLLQGIIDESFMNIRQQFNICFSCPEIF